MDRNEKEKLSRYGKLVCDFANGKTTDDILISFFNNLQAAFNFSKDFTRKALELYPIKKTTISSLSEKEKQLTEILLKRNEILFENHLHWCRVALDIYIEKYDPIALTFTILEIEWKEKEARKEGEPDYIEKTFLIPESEIETYFDNSVIKPGIGLISHGKKVTIRVLDDDWKDELKKQLKTITLICTQIENIKSDLTNRFEEIEKITDDYKDISEIHQSLEENQEDLKFVLMQIIEGKSAYKSYKFDTILSRYNRNDKKKIIARMAT
ncbi:MAG: hypothetical protein Q8O28_03580 [Smithellaceae bacterium]|nr:hypothetical protein [Smithellaceae bacterium]